MAVCLQPAAVGGASTFTDGLAIAGELASTMTAHTAVTGFTMTQP